MHIVTGELRKPPYIKDGCGQDGQSKMYILELSEVIKDYQTQEKSYTNYSAMIFAKSQGQKDYYDKSLVEGNWVSLTADKLKVDVSDCGQYIKLRMENARVENCGYIDAGQQQSHQQGQQQAPAQQRGGYNQAPQQAAPQQGGFQQQGQQQQAKAPDLDQGWDDIPFSQDV
tara:strand:- start:875 stop:1387 length:513 start_codon:yes stop_codon:yes gene_type:complete